MEGEEEFPPRGWDLRPPPSTGIGFSKREGQRSVITHRPAHQEIDHQSAMEEGETISPALSLSRARALKNQRLDDRAGSWVLLCQRLKGLRMS